jgi:tol-pal system protein YbgF
MRGNGAPLALVVALLLGSSTAAHAANKEQQQLMAELRMLQQHQQQLQQMVVTLTESLKIVTSRMDDEASAERKALADQRLLIEGLSDTVRVLREKADDTNVRLSTFTQELEAIRQTIASQPQPAPIPAGEPTEPAPVNPSAPGGPPAPAAPPAAPATAPPPGVSPQRTYEAAYSDYAGGQYEVAIMGFDTFLKFFPRHPLADEAQLNIGNSLYNAGKFNDAITAYQRVISDHANTESVPPAHYKLGLAYNELKQPDLARKAFQTVIDTFPASPEATLAKQALERVAKPR